MASLISISLLSLLLLDNVNSIKLIVTVYYVCIIGLVIHPTILF